MITPWVIFGNVLLVCLCLVEANYPPTLAHLLISSSSLSARPIFGTSERNLRFQCIASLWHRRITDTLYPLNNTFQFEHLLLPYSTFIRRGHVPSGLFYQQPSPQPREGCSGCFLVFQSGVSGATTICTNWSLGNGWQRVFFNKIAMSASYLRSMCITERPESLRTTRWI